mmetsp:Transcript_1036/g.4439  ORF Transcript_1036/g.4439 Transcript_1036/m.4439 type:complete len:255 (+) Transcript_1036:297-1061(+)
MAHENPHSYRDGNGDADHEEADIEGRVLGLGLVARVLLALGVFKGELREVEAADHAGLVPPRRRGDVVVNVLQDSRMLHVGVEKLLGFCADLGEERLALHHPSREHDPLGRYQQHRSGTEPSHGVREDIPHLLIVRKRGQLGWIAAVKRGESSAGADSLNAVAVKHAGAGEVIRVIGPAGDPDVGALPGGGGGGKCDGVCDLADARGLVECSCHDQQRYAHVHVLATRRAAVEGGACKCRREGARNAAGPRPSR